MKKIYLEFTVSDDVKVRKQGGYLHFLSGNDLALIGFPEGDVAIESSLFKSVKEVAFPGNDNKLPSNDPVGNMANILFPSVLKAADNLAASLLDNLNIKEE